MSLNSSGFPFSKRKCRVGLVAGAWNGGRPKLGHHFRELKRRASIGSISDSSNHGLERRHNRFPIRGALARSDESGTRRRPRVGLPAQNG